MTDDTMVERMARAVFERVMRERKIDDAEWDDLLPATKDGWLSVARAEFLPLVREAQEKAFDYGAESGSSRAMRRMSDEPELSLEAPNPYRTGDDQ